MDQRQQQIREGAGLEESRLNTEFIDFVQKWGGPFLILCAIGMGGWAAWNWWTRQKATRLDEAFAQYEAQLAGGNPNPIALESVAAEFEGVASVSLLARLDAADIYLASVRSGVRAGAQLNPDGTPAAPEDLLAGDERDRVLAQAEALYRQVYESASGSRGKGLLAIEGLYGLAAASECRGDVAQARAHYERIVELAEASGFSNHVTLARSRMSTLERLASAPVLLATAELAVRPAPPAPVLPDLSPDAGPVGPVAPEGPGLLDAPLTNPLNPEAAPGGGAAPSPSPSPEPTPGAEPGASPPAPSPAPGEPTTPPGR